MVSLPPANERGNRMTQNEQIQAITLCTQAINEIYKPHIDNKIDLLRQNEDVNISVLDDLLGQILTVLEDLPKQCRLDRIEAVWQEYKHLDYLLVDKEWLPDTSIGHILHDLWRAIRRDD